MIALYIVGGLVALIFLLLISRVGIHLVYRPERKLLRVRLGVFFKTIRLDEPRAVKPKRRKKEEKPKRRRSFEEIMELARAALHAAGRLAKAVKVHKMEADVIVGGDDPADAAISFGRLQIIWYSMAPLLRHCQITPAAVRFYLDFDAPKTTAQGELKLSVRVGALLGILLKFGMATLKMRKLPETVTA